MTTTTKEVLLREFAKALETGTAAIFVGAGMSRPQGFVDWKGLMRDVASELNLDVERESDMVALAQYHKNHIGNRSRLDQLLIEEFTRDVTPGRNHQLIATLPIRNVWTTNYDTLLEDAFKAAHKRVDVKIQSSHLKTTMPHHDVTIYKMHGDVSNPSDAVLTKDDYERYSERRPMFVEKLKGDLLSNTFLFLGFSFSDPNIDYVLSRLRALMGEDIRNHYCVMKQPTRPIPFEGEAKADFEYETRKLEHRTADLKRYGIQAVLIDDYPEITDILEKLNNLGHRKDIFVSGSAHEAGTFGQARLQNLVRRLGREIIEHDYNLVSGFGLGVGSEVLVGALEALYLEDSPRMEDRVMIRPFPRQTPTGMTSDAFKTRYREDLIGQSGCVVFVAGNKAAPDGSTIEAPGVLEEFRIATTLGKTPIPIGATGYAAKTIWIEVFNDQDRFYPNMNVNDPLSILGDEQKSDDELLEAAFEILREVRRVGQQQN